MIHTSVTIAAGKTATIPRSTDLVNSIAYENGSYHQYNGYGNSRPAGWGDATASDGPCIITDVSSSTYTVKNTNDVDYVGLAVTLYYSYTE